MDVIVISDLQRTNGSTFSVTLPDPTVTVTVSVTVTVDDGSTSSNSLHFNPISLAEATLREFIRKLLSERAETDSVVGVGPCAATRNLRRPTQGKS